MTGHQNNADEAVAMKNLARQALIAWGVEDSDPVLLKYRENVVFRVVMPSGLPAALRIHRFGYHSDAALRSELQWMNYLQASGIPTPRPIAALSGELFVHARTEASSQSRQVDCMSWVEGRPLGQSGVPLNMSGDEAKRSFSALGRTIARMHNLTEAWPLPCDFERHAWDFGAFFSENPLWGPFTNSPLLDHALRDLVSKSREKAMGALVGFEKSARTFGLIHADLVRENILMSEDHSAQVIDFDDCGFGWRMYDVAVSLYQNREDPLFDVIECALLEGYASERTLTARDIKALPLFTALRAFAMIGWMQSRADSDAARETGARMSKKAAETATWYLDHE